MARRIADAVGFEEMKANVAGSLWQREAWKTLMPSA